MAKSIIVTVDPGLNGTGLAIWQYVTKDYWSLLEFHNVKPTKTLTLEQRLKRLVNLSMYRTQDTLGKNVTKVYCEKPRFEGSERGIAASMDDGLVRLALATGVLMGAFVNRGIDFEFVDVAQWKGQLSKETVWKRCLKARPELAERRIMEHAQDAVGLGLWVQGNLHPRQRRNKL